MNPNDETVFPDLKNARVAAIQMISTTRVEENLRTAGTLIAEAVAQGAQLVALPEYFPIMGRRDADKIAVREADGNGPIQDFLAETACKHGVWVVGGSMPLVASVEDKVLNTCLVHAIDAHSGLRMAQLLKPAADILTGAIGFVLSRHWVYNKPADKA